jgi:aspartate aminotransferase
MPWEADMPIGKKIEGFMEKSSWIRKMFEEGGRLKAEHGAENVFDFSLGNPNLEPPEQFHSVLRDLIEEPHPGLHGYMSNAGYLETRQAVADYLTEEQGVPVHPDLVVMTSGAGGALNVIFKAILDEGDEVLVPRPYFVEYGFYVDNHGGVLKQVETNEDFSLNIERIAEAITPKTRAIILNSPNNPTGRIYPEEAVRELGRLLEHKWAETGRIIFLVADEPYRKIVYGDMKVPSLMAAYPNTIVSTSYSKDLSLSGERIGFLAVSPKVPDIKRVMGALILANRILGFVNAPALMQRAIGRLQGVHVDLTLYRENRDLLLTSLRGSGFTVPEPDGAFYLFPRAPIEDDVQFVQELQERLILVVPGSGFGGPGHFRIAYCVSRQTVEGAIPIFQEIGGKYFG